MLKSDALWIREYCPLDSPALHALDQICFPRDIAFSRAEMLLCLNHRDSVVSIAELNGEIYGFAIGRILESSSAHVVTLDVAPARRRLKIGTALMNRLHEELRCRGAEICFLEVDVENSAARRLYEGFHYEYVELLQGYYGKGKDAFGMARNLKPGSGDGEILPTNLWIQDRV